ncbi:activating transcription factor 7-interacting protein 1 isoform X3 [Larimichthys crocea]|nr:activating transcription factor 7-interacting protein 1 isoform X3 [Larimichthys crocea]XP_019111960.2 activating transcription factor 7-interacting protein 1 isoform X3 [Larimichthys crocea]XP_019111961.2 activating transcription factor 7-interacting protein 1 isoform X3 [Larimichthys crocea]XP_019111962.2 activating transcription factor 7-interacting protein 1 isoform X3 [Larimichthys crocea]
MEVVVTEEKKKIFRARKTMKISDRGQLESLHSTLLTATPGLSESPPPPPLMNGTHKEDGQKGGDKEQNNSDSNSPRTTSPASPAYLSSPAPFLSLNLSPSPPSSQSPYRKEDASPTSPFHSLNFELKKMEGDEEEKGEKKVSPSTSSNESVTPTSTESKENQEGVKEVKQDTDAKEAEQAKKDSAVDLEKDSVKGLVPCSSVPSPVSDFTEPMDTDNDTVKAKDPEASTAKTKDEKPPSPKSTASDSSLPRPSSSSHPASSSCADVKQEKETKEEVKELEDDKEDVKKGSISEAKMEVDSVKVQTKKEKTEVRQTTKPSRPASTPPSNTVVQEDKGSTSGLKRTLSEGYEKDERPIKREVKRPKVERGELEAQLELKITAKAGSHHKLEKIVQQLVDERLRALQLTIFDKHFEELKERVDKIDCATKHQTAINTLQAKIARLAKKFGEANQASENKRKQEALAAAAAAAAATAAAAAAKTATVSNSPQVPRPVRTSMEVKQTPTTVSSSSTAVNSVLSALQATTSAAVQVPTSTAMVTQAPILQLITSTANAASTLATGITTQSPTGTLLLKTAPGSSMMATGQPLLIQLPLSMANGQPGTLVNIPVSSLSAANTLNKSKTTTTATFILKPAPAITTAPVSAAATVPALQASAAQMSTQISLARAVYQGGAGAITTPNAGVSVTTARTPAQSVSVAGAMSSASSPATSGPAATGSTAPGPPQGTSLTSKTDCEDGPLSSLMDCEDPANEDSEVESDQLQSNSESSEDSSEDEGGEEMWVAEWTSKNEIVWSPTHVETCRSVPAASTLIPGPTHYATTQISDPFSSFALLLTDQILEHIKAMTNLHGRRSIANWRDVDMEELQAFVGLLILAGVYRSKNEPTRSLWSDKSGRSIFPATMSFKRFQQISRALRFNDELSKTQGCDDKLADIRKVWDMWTSRLPMLFNPDRDVCVGKLFIPFKGRCSFRQYMPNVGRQPKFGIKIWTTCDVNTSYVWKLQAYTGKEAGDCAEVNQGMSLVLDMTEELKGHVVTCDKYFTSFTLADELLRRNLALVGVIRKGNPELPRHLLQARERAVFSSTFAFTETHTLVSYIQRRGKNVLLLSTKHHHPDIGDEKKGKPVIVKDYNRCKGSVNNLDKALDTYSCRRKTKCWPLALFYSLVDISLYNAYVLWTFEPSWQPNRKPYKQRLYIEEVGETLVTPHIKKRGRLPRSSAAAGIVANLRDAAPPLIGKCKGRKRCDFCTDAKRRASCSIACCKCGKVICKEHTLTVCRLCFT